MIRLTNTVDDCQFSEVLGNYCIRINGRFIMPVTENEYKDYNLLGEVFSKWAKYNYPPFWKNPFKYLFGGKKCYDWIKIKSDIK